MVLGIYKNRPDQTRPGQTKRQGCAPGGSSSASPGGGEGGEGGCWDGFSSCGNVYTNTYIYKFKV